MAIIYTYPVKNSIFDGDSFVITDAQDRNMTKQLGVGVIMAPIYTLQEEVTLLEKQVTDLYARIQDIESQISTIQEEIAALQQCCAQNAADIATNTNAIAANTEAQKALGSDIETNEAAISGLEATLNKFIAAQSETNTSLQAQINACCGGGGGEPKIVNVTPVEGIDDGGSFTITITGEDTNWLTDTPTAVNLGLPIGAIVDQFKAISDTEITLTFSVPEGFQANGGYDVSVVAGDSSASCERCWNVSPNAGGAVILGLEPNKAERGETITTVISVENMPGPIISVNLGPGVTVDSFTLEDDGSISVIATVSEDAEIGLNDISVIYGDKESATLENAFEIESSAVSCIDNPILSPLSTYSEEALPVQNEDAGFEAWGGVLYSFRLGATPPPPSTAPILWRFTADAPGSTFPSPPEWMTLTDNGDNTCTISGTPTVEEIGTQYSMGVEAIRSDCPDKFTGWTWGITISEKP